MAEKTNDQNNISVEKILTKKECNDLYLLDHPRYEVPFIEENADSEHPLKKNLTETNFFSVNDGSSNLNNGVPYLDVQCVPKKDLISNSILKLPDLDSFMPNSKIFNLRFKKTERETNPDNIYVIKNVWKRYIGAGLSPKKWLDCKNAVSKFSGIDPNTLIYADISDEYVNTSETIPLYLNELNKLILGENVIVKLWIIHLKVQIHSSGVSLSDLPDRFVVNYYNNLKNTVPSQPQTVQRIMQANYNTDIGRQLSYKVRKSTSLPPNGSGLISYIQPYFKDYQGKFDVKRITYGDVSYETCPEGVILDSLVMPAVSIAPPKSPLDDYYVEIDIAKPGGYIPPEPGKTNIDMNINHLKSSIPSLQGMDYRSSIVRLSAELIDNSDPDNFALWGYNSIENPLNGIMDEANERIPSNRGLLTSSLGNIYKAKIAVEIQPVGFAPTQFHNYKLDYKFISKNEYTGHQIKAPSGSGIKFNIMIENVKISTSDPKIELELKLSSL